MKKIKTIEKGWKLKNKHPNINKNEFYFVFEDDSIEEIAIYEPHNWFKYGNIFIVYGHENIMLFDIFGKLKVNEITR